MTPKPLRDQSEALHQNDSPPGAAGRQRIVDIAAILDGIADMENGRIITLDEVDRRIRNRLDLHSK
jgi:predicted transcriptional regulator